MIMTYIFQFTDGTIVCFGSDIFSGKNMIASFKIAVTATSS